MKLDLETVLILATAFAITTQASAQGEPDPEQEPPNNAHSPRGEEEKNSDPVYLFSGEFHLEVEDLRIPGRGMDFVWKRRYRSRPDRIGSTLGHRWQHSYDMRLVDGETWNLSNWSGFYLRDGQARLVQYTDTDGDGVFTSAGRFNEIRAVTGGYELTRPDKTTWTFYPYGFDTEPSTAGRLKEIKDRNGNTIQFSYDSEGLIQTITDTLDRQITLDYDQDGRVTEVQDWIGRKVTYTYYSDTDPNGSEGDLETVTSPAVVGTPTGNDFPQGKTWTYRYNEGETDDSLNHYITEVIDPKGQTTITNSYELTTDPNAVSYYRITSQIHGDGTFQCSYHDVTPDPSNNDANRLTIVNDRMGNVRHLYYDYRNTLVMYREYTGRADPAQPTTLTTNLPQGKLRATDPDYFEKRYEFDDEFNTFREVMPNGNTIDLVYDTGPTSDPRSRGNLLSRTLTPGPLGGEQTQLVEQWTYHSEFNFVTSHTPPRGATHATTYQYDAAGNRTSITYPTVTVGTWGGQTQDAMESFEYDSFGRITAHVWPGGRRDESTYYDASAGPLEGYLETEVIDALGLALTTTFDYDDVGNVTSVTDPRGSTTSYLHNELNQVVREISPAPFSYITYTFYDANDNVESVHVQNVDHTGVTLPNPFITTEYDYDVLNNVIEERREVDEVGGAPEWVVQRYAYDANENLILETQGESVAQAGNAVAYEYDERDLVFRTILGPGTSDESTDEFDYDGNKNVVRLIQGTEDVPRIMTFTVDGYDRRTSTTDGEGNLLALTHDAHGNVLTERFEGEVIEVAPGSTAGNTDMHRLTRTYDERDRLIATSEDWFDLDTGASIGDGSSDTSIFYDEDSLQRYVTDDNGHTTEAIYDGAHRVSRVVDPAGHEKRSTYDAASNVTMIEEIELPAGGAPAVTYTTTSTYDSLDRRASTTDSDGKTATFAFDSRGNLAWLVDRRGNTTLTAFDGLNRPLVRTFDLRTGGTGAGAVEDTVVISWEWDRSSRLIARTDGEGNRTEHEYDPLNRVTRTVYADGTEDNLTYDVHDNVVTRTDANGSVTTSTYDLLNRVKSRTVARAPLVKGTTFEQYDYDGLSRVVLAADDDTTVTRRFDSHGNLVREDTLVSGSPMATTVFSHDGVGNITGCVYPGLRTLTTTYDSLDQQLEVDEGATTLASYTWDGPGRMASISRANGTSTVYAYDAVRRISGAQHDGPSGALSDWSFSWDEESNKSQRVDILESHTDDYEYDSLGRLVQSTTSNPSMPDTGYEFDDANNRISRTLGSSTQTYTLDAGVPHPADEQMNQYTRIPARAGAEDQLIYDENGNMVRVEIVNGPVTTIKKILEYDYRNQMVSLQLASGVVHEYLYDAFGRRVAKVLDSQGTPTTTTFAYAHDEVIEERGVAGATLATYVLGAFLDEPVSMQRGGVDYYYHADDQGSVMALTSAAGGVVERYDYVDYGRPVDGDTYGTLASSSVGNPYFFTGRRRDTESKWYYYRTRYYIAKWGRFTTRDTIGIWGDESNIGNGFAYLKNSPWSAVDPYGEGFWDWVQGGLDVAGMIPVIGNAADLVNAGISAARGNWDEASLNLGAAIPGAGQAVTAAKWANKGRKLVGNAKRVRGATSRTARGGKRSPWKKGKPGRKKGGREPGEKKRQHPSWKPRHPPKEPPKHTPSPKHYLSPFFFEDIFEDIDDLGDVSDNAWNEPLDP